MINKISNSIAYSGDLLALEHELQGQNLYLRHRKALKSDPKYKRLIKQFKSRISPDRTAIKISNYLRKNG